MVRTIGGPGSGAGQLNGPLGVAVDGDGNVLVADHGNRRIVVFLGPREAARAEVGLPATATDAELEHRKAELEAKRRARAEVGLPAATDAEL